MKKNPTQYPVSDIPNTEGFKLILEMNWGSWIACTVRKDANGLHFLELDWNKTRVDLKPAIGWHHLS